MAMSCIAKKLRKASMSESSCPARSAGVLPSRETATRSSRTRVKSCTVSTAIVSAWVCTTPIVSAREVMTASIACEGHADVGSEVPGAGLGAGMRAGWAVACQEEVDVGDAARVGLHALSSLLQHLAAAQPPGLRAASCPHPARNNTGPRGRHSGGEGGERGWAAGEAKYGPSPEIS